MKTEKTENVKQIITTLFRINYKAYPECYPLHSNGIPTNEAFEFVTAIAHEYYACRSEDEIERDEYLGITESDYVTWCCQEFASINYKYIITKNKKEDEGLTIKGMVMITIGAVLGTIIAKLIVDLLLN